MRLLIIILYFLLCASSRATLWYVDSTATGSNAGTSWGNAWTNVTRITGLSAGDTVYISGGASGSTNTYALNGSGWTIANGSSGNITTYQIGQDSSHNGVALFTGNAGDTIFANNPSYVTVSGSDGDGLRHFASSGFCALIPADDYTPLDFTWQYWNCGTVTANNGSEAFFETGYNVTGLDFDHDYIFYAATNASTVFIISTIPTTSSFGVNAEIFDNYVATIGQNGGGGYGASAYEISGSSWDAYNNTNILVQTNIWNEAVGRHEDGFQCLVGNNIRVYGNFIYGFSNIGVYFGGVVGDGTSSFEHLRIYNNIVDGGVGQQSVGCIQVEEDSPSGFTNSDILVFNNLCRVPPQGNGQGSGFYFGSSASGGYWSQAYCSNNFIICSNASQQGVVIVNATVSNGDNPNARDFTASNYLVNLVTNSSASNYHLTSGATNLIQQGINLYSLATVDKDGNARPSTGAWDIGAYQYTTNSGGGSTTSVPALPMLFMMAAPITNYDSTGTNIVSFNQKIGWTNVAGAYQFQEWVDGAGLTNVADVGTNFTVVSNLDEDDFNYGLMAAAMSGSKVGSNSPVLWIAKPNMHVWQTWELQSTNLLSPIKTWAWTHLISTDTNPATKIMGLADTNITNLFVPKG